MWSGFWVPPALISFFYAWAFGFRGWPFGR